jgi:hypothetical protein
VRLERGRHYRVELSVYEMEIHQLEQRTSATTFCNTCSKAVGLVPEALDSVKAAMLKEKRRKSVIAWLNHRIDRILHHIYYIRQESIFLTH